MTSAWTLARTGTDKPPQAGRSGVGESTREVLRSVWEGLVPELARLVAALGIRRGRAEDLLQEVFLAAWEKPPAGMEAGDVRRWLFRVAINRCHLEHRRRARWGRVLGGLARLWPFGPHGEAETAGALAGQREERAAVRRALERLEPPLRTALVLRYFLEMDSAQIGAILEEPPSTVRSRLRAARLRLASELTRAGSRQVP